MKEFTIGKNDAGQRLDRWLAKTLPLLPAPLAQKYIRLKRVKVNGRPPSIIYQRRVFRPPHTGERLSLPLSAQAEYFI